MDELVRKHMKVITAIASEPIRPEDEKLLGYTPSSSIIEGKRYKAYSPDTLDLAERLELAIIPATNRYYTEERWHMGFLTFLMRPYAFFKTYCECGWLSIAPKVIQALIYCRLASGSDLNMEVERKLLATQLGLIGRDGLTYSPLPPADGIDRPEYSDYPDKSNIWNEGRWLQTFALLAQIDPSPSWTELARLKTDRLLELTVVEGGFRFFCSQIFDQGHVNDRSLSEEDVYKKDPSNTKSVNYSRAYCSGAVCHGAAQFYKVSGYEPALILCRDMVRWAMAKIYTREDGRYLVEHFYHGVYPLIGMASYAEITGDMEVFKRVEACYRWARDMGDPLVGFYSTEMPGGQAYIDLHQEYMEICALSNMCIVALHLSRNGIGDYWDDVDRWARNSYAQSQMTDLGVLDLPDDHFSSAAPFSTYTNGFNTNNIEIKNLGSFSTTITGNDVGVMREGKFFGAIASCCVTNGPRALYCIWDSIIEGRGEDVRVNLLLNRASEWADIDSYIPVAGKVKVRVKKNINVEIRMPGWADMSGVKACINGKHIHTQFKGRYIFIRRAVKGDVIDISFPMPEEETVTHIIGERPYRLTVKGSNVVRIDPPGIVQPFYTKHPEGKLMEKDRFVTDKRIIW